MASRGRRRAAARGGRRRTVARRARACLPGRPRGSGTGRRGVRVIDTHCHLLHSLDDGPKTERDSVELARQLAAAGVRAVVCTPHFSRRYSTSLVRARKRIAELSRLLLEAPILLSLSLAWRLSEDRYGGVVLAGLTERVPSRLVGVAAREL